MAVQNMYHPVVGPDTQGVSAGIAAAGQALASGIEQLSSTRSAAKAAEAEFDLFQQMYPGAAAMIDTEKFHAANLAGKQKMLGMGKGYVLEQLEKEKAGQEMSLKQLEMNLRREDLGLRREEMQQRMAIQAGQLELSAKELGQRSIEAGDLRDFRGKTLSIEERKLVEDTLRRSRGFRMEPVEGTPYKAVRDPAGNADKRFPPVISVPNPAVPGTMIDIPVPAQATTTKAPAIREFDPSKKYGRWNASTGKFEPVSLDELKEVDPLNRYSGAPAQ